MLKRISSFIGLVALMVLLTGIMTAAAPVPNTTITLVQGLPSVMNVGDTYTVVVQVESDQPFNTAMALPSFHFPGKGVAVVQGGDHAGQGTNAMLELTFKAKSSTAEFPGTANCPSGGVAPVSVVVGARYTGGYVAVQRFEFCVQVP